MPDSVPFFVSEDLFTALHIDPNQQYVPIRPLLQTLALTPTTHERALRRHAVLATGLKPLWILTRSVRIPAFRWLSTPVLAYLPTLSTNLGAKIKGWFDGTAR